MAPGECACLMACTLQALWDDLFMGLVFGEAKIVTCMIQFTGG